MTLMGHHIALNQLYWSNFLSHIINSFAVQIYSTKLCDTKIFYSDAKDWYNINEGDMPPCERMPCRNDGVCIPHKNNLHDYTCNCTAGFSGRNCETHIACESENCNGGECIPKASNPLDFVCLCPFGRVGVQCQTGGYAIEPWIKTADHFDYVKLPQLPHSNKNKKKASPLDSQC